MTPEMTAEKREKWLDEIRDALRRTRGLPGEQGRVPVRAPAGELNWLCEQLGPETMARIDLFVAPESGGLRALLEEAGRG